MVGVVAVAGIADLEGVETAADARVVDVQVLPLAALDGRPAVVVRVARDRVVLAAREDYWLAGCAIDVQRPVDLNILSVVHLEDHARVERECDPRRHHQVAVHDVGHGVGCQVHVGVVGALLEPVAVIAVVLGLQGAQRRPGDAVLIESPAIGAECVYVVERGGAAEDPDRDVVVVQDIDVPQGRRRVLQLHPVAAIGMVVVVTVPCVADPHVLEDGRVRACIQIERLPVAAERRVGAAVVVGVAAGRVVAPAREDDGLVGRALRQQGAVDADLLLIGELDDLARHDGERVAAVERHVGFELDGQAAGVPGAVAGERAALEDQPVAPRVHGAQSHQGRCGGQVHPEGAPVRVLDRHLLEERCPADDLDALAVGVNHARVADGGRAALGPQRRETVAVVVVVVVAGVADVHVVEDAVRAGGVEADALPVATLWRRGPVVEGVAEGRVVALRGEDDRLGERALRVEGAVHLDVLFLPELHHDPRVDGQLGVLGDREAAAEHVGHRGDTPRAVSREGARAEIEGVVPVVEGHHVGVGGVGRQVVAVGIAAGASHRDVFQGRRATRDPHAVAVHAQHLQVPRGRCGVGEVQRAAIAATVARIVVVARVADLDVLEHRGVGAGVEVDGLPVALDRPISGAIVVRVAAHRVVAPRGEDDGLVCRALGQESPVDVDLFLVRELDWLPGHDRQRGAAGDRQAAVELDGQPPHRPRAVTRQGAAVDGIAVAARIHRRQVHCRHVGGQGAVEGGIPCTGHLDVGQGRRAGEDADAVVVEVAQQHVGQRQVGIADLDARAEATPVTRIVVVPRVAYLDLLEHRGVGAVVEVERLPVAPCPARGPVGIGVAARRVVPPGREDDRLLGRGRGVQAAVEVDLALVIQLHDLARHHRQRRPRRHRQQASTGAIELHHQAAEVPGPVRRDRAPAQPVAVQPAGQGRERDKRRIRVDGCREGALPRALDRHPRQGRVAGDDVDARAIDIAHQHIGQRQVGIGDLDGRPVPVAVAGVVVVAGVADLDVLEHRGVGAGVEVERLPIAACATRRAIGIRVAAGRVVAPRREEDRLGRRAYGVQDAVEDDLAAIGELDDLARHHRQRRPRRHRQQAGTGAIELHHQAAEVPRPVRRDRAPAQPVAIEPALGGRQRHQRRVGGDRRRERAVPRTRHRHPRQGRVAGNDVDGRRVGVAHQHVGQRQVGVRDPDAVSALAVAGVVVVARVAHLDVLEHRGVRAVVEVERLPVAALRGADAGAGEVVAHTVVVERGEDDGGDLGAVGVERAVGDDRGAVVGLHHRAGLDGQRDAGLNRQVAGDLDGAIPQGIGGQRAAPGR